MTSHLSPAKERLVEGEADNVEAAAADGAEVEAEEVSAACRARPSAQTRRRSVSAPRIADPHREGERRTVVAAAEERLPLAHERTQEPGAEPERRAQDELEVVEAHLVHVLVRREPREVERDGAQEVEVLGGERRREEGAQLGDVVGRNVRRGGVGRRCGAVAARGEGRCAREEVRRRGGVAERGGREGVDRRLELLRQEWVGDCEVRRARGRVSERSSERQRG